MYKRKRTLSYPSYSQSTEIYSQGSQTAMARRGKYPRSRRSIRLYRPIRTATPYNMVYPFERTVVHNCPLNLNSGWFTKGYGLSFAFSLSTLVVTYGDSAESAIAMPADSDFTNLFDQYRIDRVDMEIYYSATNHQAVSSATNTIVMSVINCVTDYDNRAVSSVNNLLEYPQCRSQQLGSNRPFRHTVTRPAANVSAEVEGSSTGVAMSKKSGWFDTAFPDVLHHGIKISYQDFGSGTPDYSPDLTAGVAQFRFKVYYSFKNPR